MSDPKTSQWQQASHLDDLWEGDMEGVEIGEEKVLLVNVEGEVRAYRNVCPHQASALDEGDFDGETITCARHLWVFDALSGRGVNPENSQLHTFACRVTETGEIVVDLG
jgi:toluene monooxygenase system ferredoxin subunit